MLGVVRPLTLLPELAPLVAQLVLLELALGTACCSLLIDTTGAVGRGFVGTTALICAVVVAIDLPVSAAIGDPSALLQTSVGAAARGQSFQLQWAFMLALLISALFCWIGTDIARRVVGLVACGIGIFAIFSLGAELAPAIGGVARAMFAVVPASLLFGSALSGMLLGHWYLISPNLSFKPLRQAIYLVYFAVLVRTVEIIAAIVYSSSDARDSLLSGSGATLFWLLVVGAGIIFTLAVNIFTHYFVRIRSNQPATAMLYVLIVAVAMGVIPGHLLYMLTGVPI